jgi:hypothetical protein
MSTYYFDVFVQDRLTEDEFGIELPDIEAAIDECANALTDVSGETLARGQDGAVVMLIRDESGRSVYKATLAISFEHLPASPKYLAEVELQREAGDLIH